MEVMLPKNVGTRNLAGLFALCGQVLRSEDENIVLDARQVQFFDPHGIAVLAALLSSLEGRRVSMPWLPTNYAGYLDRMDFFKHCQVHDVEIPAWNRLEHPDSLVELTCVTDSSSTESVANRLADAITGQLTDADPQEPYGPDTGKNRYDRFRHPIWYSLSELLENSVTHARMDGYRGVKVWVAAQFYRKNNEVKFSIVDNGCGFLRTLGKHPELREHTHLEAIKTALKAMVSCNRESPYALGHGNQGVGLTTTMRIAKAAKGKLMIASGDSFLETENMNGGELSSGGLWKGVAIAFTCRRHALPAVNVSNLLPQTPKPANVTVNFVD
jgi:hypothetical protein